MHKGLGPWATVPLVLVTMYQLKRLVKANYDLKRISSKLRELDRNWAKNWLSLFSKTFYRIDHPQPNVKRFCPSKYFWQWQKWMKAVATKGLPFAEFWALQKKNISTQYYLKVRITMSILVLIWSNDPMSS